MTNLEDVMSKLKTIEAKLDAIAGSRAPAPNAAATATRGRVATDYEMDGPWGDPVQKKDPPRWKGDSYAGCKLSECPVDYLECLAEFKDWQADMNDQDGKVYKKEGKPDRAMSEFGRKDAALARGWAQRARDGVVGQKPKAASAARYGGTSASGSALKHTGSPEPDAFDVDQPGGASADDIPFVSSVDAIAPHVRRCRWEKF